MEHSQKYISQITSLRLALRLDLGGTGVGAENHSTSTLPFGAVVTLPIRLNELPASKIGLLN